MSLISNEDSLVCLEFPGRVENPNRLLDLLGGRKNLVKALCDKNRRLELRFRPEDPHCKPTCGERVSATSFLLRVKVFKRKKKSEDAKDQDDEEVKLVPEVVAPVSVMYAFNNLVDFQYLPVLKEKGPQGEYKSVIEHVQLNKLERVSNYYQDLERVPLFIPPAVFSRMDAPQDYHFRREAANLKGVSNLPQNIIGRTRKRRSHHTIFALYDSKEVPQQPLENAGRQMEAKFINKNDFEIIQQKFDEDPIWSKNALIALSGLTAERLKFILPTVAYYFTTGPWRNFWVRFKYDPRLDRSAWKYQSLDYRVRVEGGINRKIKAKRNYANYLLPYKGTNWSKPKTSLIKYGLDSDISGQTSKTRSTSVNENLYLFKPGMIPPYRQMFYMFKHLMIDEAQELMLKNLKPEGASCDEKNGWFLSGIDSKLREIMTREIKKVIAEESILEETNLDD